METDSYPNHAMDTDDESEDEDMDDLGNGDLILNDGDISENLAELHSFGDNLSVDNGGRDDEKSDAGYVHGSHISNFKFSRVSSSSIIPYQPSLLGKKRIGRGPSRHFDYNAASKVMSDLSHLGMIHCPDSSNSGLIRMPDSFVELYNIVNKVKRRDLTSADDSEDNISSEMAICLLTGSIMRSGSPRRDPSRSRDRQPGPCTLHARQIGSGVGIFFLVQKCTVLLMHNNKSAYSASLYVDDHGEEDPGLRRGRPLFLKKVRYQALETLWRQHGIPREVAQIRSTSDRVIRDNWY